MRRSGSSDSLDTSAATTGGEVGPVAAGLKTDGISSIDQVNKVEKLSHLSRGLVHCNRSSDNALLGANVVEDDIELNKNRIKREIDMELWQDETAVKPSKESKHLEVQPQAAGSRARAIGDGKEYLKSYERMVRHQDLEFDATSEYMKIIFNRIQTLGTLNDGYDDEMFDSSFSSSVPSGMLTYLQMRRCLLRIGVGWDHGDEEVHAASLNSPNSTSSLGAGGGSVMSDILLTDAQLIMLLKTLVEIDVRDSKMMLLKGEGSYKSSKLHGLFLADFIQAYTLLISGMQSLKFITVTDGSSQSDLCKRLKERTLGMLRMFGPNTKESNFFFLECLEKVTPKPNQRSFSGKIGRGFSNDDVKKMICSKDLALARVIENHESEMGLIASSIEELRVKHLRQRASWRRKRKFVRLMVAAFLAALVSGVSVVEYRRRVFLASAIALERETEAKIHAETITRLTEERNTLEKKLGLIEGKIRYHVNRNNDVEARTHGIEEAKNDLDMKLLVAQAETDNCFDSQIEFKESLKREHIKQTEVDEELLWCQSRLSSQERELSEVQHIRVVGSTKGLAAASNSNETAKVYLEMKYNKSIRNAIFLRQTISAVAGLAVSIGLQLAIPAIIKLFFAPQATAVLRTTPVVPGRDVEMALVDGIFGSSVAFLVVKAIATWLMPL